MSPKIHPDFWRDPDIEAQPAEGKLTVLWLITNPATTILGTVIISERRFSFETSLPPEWMKKSLQSMPRSISLFGDTVFIRNYIRHQFGTGEQLTRNTIWRAIHSGLNQLTDKLLRAAIIAEYPELKDGHTIPIPSPSYGVRKGTGEGTGNSSEGVVRGNLVPATEAQAVEWAAMDGTPAPFAVEIYHQCEATGWVDGTGNRPIGNWRSYVKTRWIRRQSENEKAKANGNQFGKPIPRKTTAEDHKNEGWKWKQK